MRQILPHSPAPAPLPEPRLEQLFLDNPAVPAILLGAAALALFMAARGRPGRRLLLGGVPAAAAVVVWLLPFAVTTDRQRIREASLRLVRAAAAVDLEALGELLDADCTLHHVLAPRGVPREAALDHARRYLGGTLAVREHRVAENQAVVGAPGQGRSQVHVQASLHALPGRHASWWRVRWRRGGDGEWRAVEIRALRRELAAPADR